VADLYEEANSCLFGKILFDEFMLTKQVTEKQRSSEPSVTHLDVDKLLYRCIHKAAAVLRDYEADRARKTERVSILLRLFQRQQGDRIISHIVISSKYCIEQI